MEANFAEAWMSSHFRSDMAPFSFIYDGRQSKEIIKDWKQEHSSRNLSQQRTQHTFTYLDPETKLQISCDCLLFGDFPAIEWVMKLRNTSDKDTPIVERIQVLDCSFRSRDGQDPILHRALGSSAAKNDFAPIDDAMRPGFELQLAPIGGRSSNTTALPFFNIEGVEEGGVVLALGWSGQWATSFTRGTELRITAGMELTHLKLHPNEEIRTPSILLLFWKGQDHIQGHNLLRRFILAHHMPKKYGKPVTLMLACSSGSLYQESNRATEQNQIDFASRFAPLGVEYHWIDAGWFEGGWPNGVGNWFIDRNRFPKGMKSVSEALRRMRLGLILWFEPERVHQGTWLDREHPEWVLKLQDNPNGLLNLGNEGARKWLFQHISDMIKNEGIEVYRQDFNMDPLPYWRATDEPDRQGMTEIRHIEGLYTLWDELLTRNPNLIIDNCASGGRRIDLETVSRSVALWRTDYNYFEPNGYQCHTYGISLYLPSTSTGSGYPELYSFRSSINSGVVLDWNPFQPEIPSLRTLPFQVDIAESFPREKAIRLIEDFKRIRHFFFGDFYPLTPYSIADNTWMAYQFHREDLHQGMILVFRRPESPSQTLKLKPKGLRSGAFYGVIVEGDSSRQNLLLGDLDEGLDVTIESAPGSLLITYTEIE